MEAVRSGPAGGRAGARRGVRLLAAAGVVAVAGLALVAPASAGTTTTVGSTDGFARAMGQLAASGGTVVLRPGRYGRLVVPPRAGPTLAIEARDGATAQRLVLDGTHDVVVRGLRILPSGQRGGVSVVGASDVALERLSLTDGGRGLNVDMTVLRSQRVRISDSTFTRCGSGEPPDSAICLRLRDTRDVVIERSWFHDCNGCDFVHGSYNDRLTVRDSVFERALVGLQCGHHFTECNHQDLIHLIDGGDVLIERNRFGIYEFGEAQVFLSGPIRGVTVRNNVFLGHDPDYPGYEAPRGITLGTKRSGDAPRSAVVVNNTILTGHARADGYSTSILFSPAYTRLPVEERPLVANNVIARIEAPSFLCERVQASVSNVLLHGRACSPADDAGDPQLDAEGRPTAASRLVIDRADVRYATEQDVRGTRRDARPDIGAYER